MGFGGFGERKLMGVDCLEGCTPLSLFLFYCGTTGVKACGMGSAFRERHDGKDRKNGFALSVVGT